MAETMTRESLDDFFTDYANAFSRGDVEEIARLWKLPAFITTRDRSACFADPEAFRRNIEAVCAFYRRQGVVRAKKRVLEINLLGEGIAAVTTSDELFGGAGEEIARWKHAYLVRGTVEGLRAIAAVADSEVEAWKARGTPLGG
jgi:hypothetical protein